VSEYLLSYRTLGNPVKREVQKWGKGGGPRNGGGGVPEMEEGGSQKWRRGGGPRNGGGGGAQKWRMGGPRIEAQEIQQNGVEGYSEVEQDVQINTLSLDPR